MASYPDGDREYVDDVVRAAWGQTIKIPKRGWLPFDTSALLAALDHE